MNELATNLFKNLIDLGYKYITNVLSNSLTFTINNIRYDICIVKAKYKEAELIGFEPFHVTFPAVYHCNCFESENVDSTIFRINFNHRYFDVKLSRVEFAQYLDKIEHMINKWYEDKMIEAINLLDSELKELDQCDL